MLLEIGARGPLHTRIVPIERFGGTAETRLLYMSDLHLRDRADHVITQVIEAARAAVPEAVLLGGDLVDRRGDLKPLTHCVRQLVEVCPVWAIPGNHDEYAGVQEVQHAVEAAGGGWFHRQRVILLHAGRHVIRIDGGLDAPKTAAAFSILCAHYPSVFPQAVRDGYDLVLAGHLHGSLIALVRHGGRTYPGAWFYRWNGDEFHEGQTTMLVSRGVYDTVPIRWNCPREVILCKIT